MNMNKTWLARIGIGLLVVAAMVAVAGVAYRIGVDDDVVRDVGREVVVAEDGTRTVIVDDDWRGGWRGGPGFGFLFFPLVVVGLILLFRSRRDRWGGGPRGDAEWRDWHRRQHVADVPVAPTPTTVTGDSPPAPSGA